MIKAICVMGLVVILLLSLSASCGGGATQPTTSEPVTTLGQSLTVLSSVSGIVTLLKAGSSNWLPGTAGIRLDINDTIKTEAGARAAVTFFDGSTIELAGATEITVLELSRQTGGQATTVSVRQEIGQTVSQVSKFLDPASRYEVVTPAAIAAVRGSAMLVNVLSDGTTTVGNIEGQIVVSAQGVELTVPQGQHCDVLPGQAPTPAQPGLTSLPLTTPVIALPPYALMAEVIERYQVKLSWEDKSDDDDGFIIERAGSELFNQIEKTYINKAGVQTFTDIEVSRGVTYYYRVWSVHGQSKRGPTNWIMVTIPPEDTTRPPTTSSSSQPSTTTSTTSNTTYAITSTVLFPSTTVWPPGLTITARKTTTTSTTGPPTSSTKPTTATTTTTTSSPAPNILPVCSIRANRTSGIAPLNVTFTLSASDSDGSIVSWQLDVNGDGLPDFSGSGGPPSLRSSTYSSPGNYLVTLAVVDNRGAVAHAFLTVRVSPLSTTTPPTSSFPPEPWCTVNANPGSGTAPLNVEFTLAAGDHDGQIVSWYFDYGDDHIDSGEGNPPSTLTHTYNGSGLYTVTFTVWDDDEHSGSSTTVVNVSPGGTLTAF